ncbi:MAG TPA: thiamine pyrophosphate-binding protein [Terriglobales bacterium]|nr:thiamine pyrophosphate-binding protein [Terriglobales bacterium]
MSSPSSVSAPATMAGAQAVVTALLRCGINCGFGIPSIHNIPIYECLRQVPEFHHRVARHEQAAGFAADGYYRQRGKIAAVFASTGPGNLFTVAPLLEALQSNTPMLVIGSNIASVLQAESGGALHETPQQIEIVRPLTRYARRVTSPDEIPDAIGEAVETLRGSLPGPAFIEIPHDFLAAPVSASRVSASTQKTSRIPTEGELAAAMALLQESRRPALLAGAGAHDAAADLRKLAERLQTPVFTTTSGKGNFPDDHPLALGCISRLNKVQEVLSESDLLISFGARITEFDSGRYSLSLPEKHIQVVEDRAYPGTRTRAKLQFVSEIGSAANAMAEQSPARASWCDVAAIKAEERRKLERLNADAYSALMLLRAQLQRNDVVVNDQSILNYWASAFFPVYEPGTFLYPYGSGTLGYGLPAAIGAACALRDSGEQQRVICIAGDGGFQYTHHELATLAQYGLPVKVLLVNDNAYGVIGFLQRTLFGHMHEVALKNPDFCRLAEAYGIPGLRARTLKELEQNIGQWLETPGPMLLEWQTELKAPWETGAISRPAGVMPAKKMQ